MKKKYFVITVILLILFVLILGSWWQTVSMLFNRVEEGVELEGIDISDCTVPEVEEIVYELSIVNEYESIDASYDVQTNIIIPEICGCKINQEATVERAMEAAAGSKLSLVREYQPPRITVADYPEAIIRQGNPEKKSVTLLINIDWGVPEPVLSMLEVLKSFNVHTTFCVTGRIMANYGMIIEEIVHNGHEIASHGYYHHSNSYNYYEMSAEQFVKDLQDTDKALTAIIESKINYYSPPSGIITDELLRAATECNYRTVLWTHGLDTIDWQEPPPAKILQRVQNGIVNGGIVLMHPKDQTLEALPEILNWLQSEGYAVVPLRELLSPYLLQCEVK